MKKILGLTIAAVLIIGLVAGGTWAFFSDIETTEDNYFTAGIIDLEISQDSTVVADGVLTDLKPCQTGYIVVTLTATAESNPMHVWKHVVDITDDDRDENDITDAEQDYYDDFLGGVAKNDIDRYIHFDTWIEVGGDPFEYNPGAGDTMIVNESEGWLLSDNGEFPWVVDSINGVTCYWIYLGTIQPGESMVIVQSFHLDASVGNWAQSDELTFTEEFFALQTVGSPTLVDLPGDELPGHTSGLPTP